MSAKDIGEAIAYSRIEPWGEARADFRAGIIASTIANSNRDSSQRALRPSDFMPNFSKSETEAERIKRINKQTLEAFNVGDNS